ncbi:proteasome/cyclosome repeat family protein [Cryptosporidium muris RN66]|uniref:Proteasome/cyclosome repeat family protein n=1 Tax=Cryptosporidium muris (strain RN66) TaxID=441375 RepID=B6AAP3_CRYMR|nr:proteasome/cyclosome repeat family protein [Cryptosporidium muris RN66]EEA05445.1 proteasome/cyclosome repeat family protein [Cryptosporidium muris RN66]|eukprot:XP_002139794.1 proteasome/cyclosome repeat family protein [Cryptosporidium muris RN66]
MTSTNDRNTPAVIMKDKNLELQKSGDSAQPEDMDMTEEYVALKEEIDGYVAHILSEIDEEANLGDLAKAIQNSTSSMTSVPKALKLLGTHFESLRDHYEKNTFKTPSHSAICLSLLAEILSILCTTLGDIKERNALKFRLLSNRFDNLQNWGQEYMRNLGGEIGLEYNERISNNNTNVDDLLSLVKTIVPYQISKHGEIEAIDLLCEVEQIETLLEYLQDMNDEQVERIVLYLQQLSLYSASNSECQMYLVLCFEILLKFKKYTSAIRMAFKINEERDESTSRILRVLQDLIIHKKSMSDSGAILENEVPLASIVKQISFQLARFGSPVSLEKIISCLNSKAQFSDQELDIIQQILSNELLSKHYRYLGKELDVLEAKSPDDVYKTHLEERNKNSSRSMVVIDTAKQNLASTYVNALVNLGFGSDKLLTVEDSTWLYKNKDSGTLAVSASLGAIYLWDIDQGLANIDKYQWSNEGFTKAGALIAFGLMSTRIQNDCDPALALLSEHVEPGDGTAELMADTQSEVIRSNSPNYTVKMGAVLGLGYSYIGTARVDILELLIPVLMDPYSSFECSAIAALSLGFVFVGTANQSVVEAVLDVLITLSSQEQSKESEGNSENTALLDDPLAILYGICLGLLFLCKREIIDPTLEALKTVTHHIGSYCEQTVIGCAYTGSGDVLQVQYLLRTLAQQKTNKDQQLDDTDEDLDEDSNLVALVSVLNIALICMCEDVGCEMAHRIFDNILQYSSIIVRRAIPIALATLSIGNPKPIVIDTVSKLTHDGDSDVALNAIFALGLIAAGTNNARAANLLRQLASYYSKDSNALYAVRIAQGLLYMGKGLVTINPLYNDRFIFNPISLASMISILHLGLKSKTMLFGNYHYLILNIIPAALPRMAITLNEQLEPIHVLVRVGQAVDTVAQAGNPRKITGFQTHNTPVLLGSNEKVEIAVDDEYIPLVNIVEDVTIIHTVEKNRT